MRSCPRCQGFVPPTLASCPHCEASSNAPSGLGLRGKFATGLLVSSTAMTLMACYGVPCSGPEGACYGEDIDTFSDTGSMDGECDINLVPEALGAQLPVSVEGTLANQPGTNEATCGGVGDEQVYEWTPPAAGSYRIAVESAAADVLLYLRTPNSSGSCGTETMCSENASGELPELTVDLSGDPVLIVVDAVSADLGGAFTLTIEAL